MKRSASGNRVPPQWDNARGMCCRARVEPGASQQHPAEGIAPSAPCLVTLVAGVCGFLRVFPRPCGGARLPRGAEGEGAGAHSGTHAKDMCDVLWGRSSTPPHARKCLQQRLRILEIVRITSLDDPMRDWCQDVIGFLALSLLLPRGSSSQGLQKPFATALRMAAYGAQSTCFRDTLQALVPSRPRPLSL